MSFWESRAGVKLAEGTLPRIASALVSIAKELKRANDLKEAEQKPDMKEKSKCQEA